MNNLVVKAEEFSPAVVGIAEEMADIFDKHSLAGGKAISGEGNARLASIFSNVPLAMRGSVFARFLTELDLRGMEYDLKAFQS